MGIFSKLGPSKATESDPALFIWRALGYGVIGLALAQFGRILEFQPHQLASLWLPAGFFFTIMLLYPSRRWLAIVAAMVPAEAIHNTIRGTALSVVVVCFILGVLQAILGAWLVKRFIAEMPKMRNMREFVGVVFLGGMVPSVFGATVVAVLAEWPRQSGMFWPTWAMWFCMCALSVLLVAPLILGWREGGVVEDAKAWPVARYVEASCLVGCLVLTSFLGFNDFWEQRMPNEFLSLPVLLWVSHRFGFRGVALADLVFCCLAAWFTPREYSFSAMAGMSPYMSVARLQMMLGLIVLASLLPAALMAEQRASERKHRALIANISDVIEVLDANGVITYESPNVERYFGWTAAEMVGRSTMDTVHPDDIERTQRDFGVLLENPGTTISARLRFRCKNGEYRPIELSAVNLIHDPFVRGVLLNYRDITRRMQNENQLARERVFTNAVLDSVPGLLYLYDDQGRLVRWNKQHETITGYSVEELAEMRLKDWYSHSEAEAAKIQRAVERCLADGYAEEEAELRIKSGEKILFHFTAVRLTIDGHPYFAGIGIDISARRQAEETLRQAQKMDAVGKLAGGVAHDFNNILAAMMMHLSLLLEDSRLDESMRESLRDLETDAQRAADLTRQLLLFGRRQLLFMRIIDLNESVNNMQKMLRRIIGEHIKVEVRLHGGPLWVKADGGMVEQVIMNLCVNARDAMAKGGVLSICTELVNVDENMARRYREAKTGTFARLSVKDTGHGMSDEVLKHVFEPFFTTKEVGKGTGLGLATVHGIVRQHGGWVDIETAVGKGTCFRLYFAHTDEAGVPTPAPVAFTAPRGGTETILFVEDAESVRQIVSKRLRSLGYRVFETANGREALLKGEELGDEIDLLLTDVVMPEGVSGLELARLFRQAHPRIRVVVSSGYSAELMDEPDRTLHGVAYLPKPYTMDELASTIRSSLDKPPEPVA